MCSLIRRCTVRQARNHVLIDINVDSVTHGQTAHYAQADLELHCPVTHIGKAMFSSQNKQIRHKTGHCFLL